MRPATLSEFLDLLCGLDTKLDKILQNQQDMKGQVQEMAKELQTLQDEVAADTSLMGSATKLIQGLAQSIRDNIGNAAELQKLADNLHTSAADLSAAVAANTPAAPPAPSQPPAPPPATPPAAAGSSLDQGGAASDTGTPIKGKKGATDPNAGL